MKRAALLNCTGLGAERFKLLQRDDLLPFFASGDDRVSRWQDYTLDDAFRLRLMMDLIDAESPEAYPTGLGPSFSRRVVQSSLAVLPLTVADAAAQSPSIYIAYAAFEGLLNDDTPDRFPCHYCGPLADLDGWIAGIIAKDGDGYRNFACKRLFMANATRAANFVLERAQELGLPEANAWA
ncbi:hypothetical protein [Paracoccus jiaweipingae]|uniref:hypothetical protein n=1 Tax=unclassified Paracoccus (in: a-proteobacteria) TaxID=2688777 RepID=UPI0037A2A85D